jgi:putative membrane protein
LLLDDGARQSLGQIKPVSTVTSVEVTGFASFLRREARRKEGQMRRMVVLPIALSAALGVACDRGDRRDVNANPNASPGAVGTSGSVDRNAVSSADKEFVHDVSIANAAEIELGKLAADRAASPQVKQFAQMMIEDHTRARDSLNTLASTHNLMTTALLDDKHRDLKDKLSALKGAEFDREYIDAMVDGHSTSSNRESTRTSWPTGRRR